MSSDMDRQPLGAADKSYPWLLLFAGVFAASMLLLAWRLPPAGDMWTLVERAADQPLYLLGLLIGLGLLATRLTLALCYRRVPLPKRARLPRISVIIPAFNEGEQVLPTIRSVMASDYPPSRMQVICIDDGSTDDTWSWLMAAKQEFPRRLQLVRQPCNMGKRQALMAGFARARAEILITIDSDSEVEVGTLRQMVAPFVADARVGAVAGNIRVLNRAEGIIPKMMEVSFATAFDFIRTGQSVFGGVYCTPGAASAYRGSVIRPHLEAWAEQRFRGKPATIGEDRALTNRVLASGYRVVYQRDAFVWTKVPVSYGGLRRMLLRWARSNVRETLVLASFLLLPFRAGPGRHWVRFFGLWQLLQLLTGSGIKLALVLQLLLHPLPTLSAVLVGCVAASIVPASVHALRYGGSFGWRWALPYTVFWLFALSWISVWALLSAARPGWLTRTSRPAMTLQPLALTRSLGQDGAAA